MSETSGVLLFQGKRVKYLSPTLSCMTQPASCLTGTCHVRDTIKVFVTKNDDGLTFPLYCYQLYLLKGEPRQPPHFLRQFYFLSVQHTLDLYIRCQLSVFLPRSLMLLSKLSGGSFPPKRCARQAYYCYFGLAFLFHTVERVNDHLYNPIPTLRNQVGCPKFIPALTECGIVRDFFRLRVKGWEKQ